MLWLWVQRWGGAGVQSLVPGVSIWAQSIKKGERTGLAKIQSEETWLHLQKSGTVGWVWAEHSHFPRASQ